jgi:transposase, IS5 family
MARVIPWVDLVALILQPHEPAGKTSPPVCSGDYPAHPPVATDLWTQRSSGRADALRDMPLYRAFARIDTGGERLPDEKTIFRFSHLFEQHDLAAACLKTINAQLLKRGLMLKAGTRVCSMLLSAPTSTKSSTAIRDLEMHQTTKGNLPDLINCVNQTLNHRCDRMINV